MATPDAVTKGSGQDGGAQASGAAREAADAARGASAAVLGEAPRGAPTTTFTSEGDKPAPLTPSSGGVSAPSASEQAFGPHPPAPVQGYRDADVARARLANPTWDPNALGTGPDGKPIKGAWVDATAARAADGHTSLVEGTMVDKRMVAGAAVDPAEVNKKLDRGTLREDELGSITPEQVARVHPLTEAPRRILQGTLHESWSHAKHTLLAPGGNEAARKMLMAKLWEYRQWHHEVILRRTQANPAIGPKGLKEWKAAGSTTLTSDIDVNLKGEKTELAVKVFNEEFKKDGWKHEAGVAYDVNVYALDFMHGGTFAGLVASTHEINTADTGRGRAPGEGHHKHVEVIQKPAPLPQGAQLTDDQKRALQYPDGTSRVSAKEGARTGVDGGGVSTDSEMLAERMVQADAQLQRVWSLVKMRLYMTGAEWKMHGEAAQLAPDVVAQVEDRYHRYMAELQAKMADGKKLAVKVDAVNMTGFQQLDAFARAKGAQTGADGENVKMAASNRIYEDKLAQMAALRAELQDQIARRELLLRARDEDLQDRLLHIEGLDAAIDGNIAMLRELISECAMFSNEAYVTDGAVNHAVVGLQSKIGIAQTKHESMDAFNENVGDSLKEIARHGGSLGEAAYKAGKYLWRMGDAAKNLGVTDPRIAALHACGYRLANEIKGGDKTQAELEEAAAKEARTSLGVGTAHDLATIVRILAAEVTLAQEPTLGARGQERAAPIKAKI